MNRFQVFALAVLASMTWGAAHAGEGRFIGDLIVKALPDGRNFELVKPFGYIDSHGTKWPVPAKTRVDGASIPSVFWSMIGAPFTGKFREASVVHDYYCQTRSRHWKAVHKVFLDAMMARQVERTQAYLMYLAVYRFGPRWNFDVNACFCKGCPVCAEPQLRRVKSYKPQYIEDDFTEIKTLFEAGRATVDKLEGLADYQLNTQFLKEHRAYPVVTHTYYW